MQIKWFEEFLPELLGQFDRLVDGYANRNILIKFHFINRQAQNGQIYFAKAGAFPSFCGPRPFPPRSSWLSPIWPPSL